MKLAKAHLVQDVQLSRLATTTQRRQLVQMMIACSRQAVILALELQTVPARSSMETPTTTASVTWMKSPAVQIRLRAITMMQRRMTMVRVPRLMQWACAVVLVQRTLTVTVSAMMQITVLIRLPAITTIQPTKLAKAHLVQVVPLYKRVTTMPQQLSAPMFAFTPTDVIHALVLRTELARLWMVIPMMMAFVTQMKLMVARTSMRLTTMRKQRRMMVLVCQATTVA
jgi:hypothetical protein